ncbi:DUF2190 family protein [Synechococcales cyanobacterium C]|uniref:DUF2190 family protein n=1 Tax=Petrachloros mirabilis ULC683 TaxID=2781853 RepID=A0A8K2A6F0_9CYAN|nr:DUF2190 family protein [Petrachloros mirabilis]NCJ05200.1 DUF2190 family protein [Petrachloros mirabilis ULC683]
MGVTFHDVLKLSLTATGSVSAARVVGFDGAQATTKGQLVAGVADYGVAMGDDFPVTMLGTALVEAGGEIAVGTPLTCDAAGRAIEADFEDGQYIFGIAMTAATGAGKPIEAFLNGWQIKPEE